MVKLALVYTCDNCGVEFSSTARSLGYQAKKYIERDIDHTREVTFKYPHRRWLHVPAAKSLTGRAADLCNYCAAHDHGKFFTGEEPK